MTNDEGLVLWKVSQTLMVEERGRKTFHREKSGTRSLEVRGMSLPGSSEREMVRGCRKGLLWGSGKPFQGVWGLLFRQL